MNINSDVIDNIIALFLFNIFIIIEERSKEGDGEVDGGSG
jgi:hypothetical protein